MSVGRVLSAGAVLGGIGLAAVLVVGMANATPRSTDSASSASLGSSSSPEQAPSSPPASSTQAGVTTSSVPVVSSTVPTPATSSSAAAVAAAPRPAVQSTATVPKTTAPRPVAPAPAPVVGGSLPLGYSTGNATRVITVVAHSTASTTATLQAWNKAPGGGWLPYGAAVTAHVGSQGLSTHPSESLSATPIGSFSLTQAFGRDANPGTGLPYLQTTAADWWISQPGALYNTHQRCASGCGFTQGDPNEHLYYETPYYDYAVVIDYNTANVGPVVQGAGSAFFLHVTDGTATAGCVSIPVANLVQIMQWLSPAAAPRILIGIA